jgi:hypothetical protein
MYQVNMNKFICNKSVAQRNPGLNVYAGHKLDNLDPVIQDDLFDDEVNEDVDVYFKNNTPKDMYEGFDPSVYYKNESTGNLIFYFILLVLIVLLLIKMFYNY